MASPEASTRRPNRRSRRASGPGRALVARWLFGRRPSASEPAAPSVPVAAVPEHLHQPRGRRGGGHDRPDGRDPARLEGLRPRAARGDRPPDGAADRRGPRPSTSWPRASSRTGSCRSARSTTPRRKPISTTWPSWSRRSAGPGESILVGRGAGFMLPRETTLSVRIIAPLKARAARLAERMGVSVRTARRAARDLDRRRTQFDRTMHRVDPDRPAQLRPGPRLAQPGPGDRRRGHRPRRRGRPAAATSRP